MQNMRPKHLVAILVLLALTLPISPVHAGGIISICDQAHTLAALAGGGTVTFSCSGTITLTNTVTIAANTTIDGSGQNVTIRGNHAIRPFLVNSGSTLNLNRLAVANGMSGGSGSGIINFGTLTLNKSIFFGDVSIYTEGTLIANDSTFSDNGYATAIVNAGTAGISNDTFSANSAPFSHGGGIYNSGTLTVSNSTFLNNSARDGGGGICNLGTLTVNNSAFSGNTTGSRNGGGIYNSGTLTVSNTTFSNNSASYGGAIYSEGSSIARTTLTVSSSTFFGNSAVHSSPDGTMGYGGGIYNAEGMLTVNNSTFVGNSADAGGGGIFNVGALYSPATVSNSTFAGNSAAVGGGIRQFGGGGGGAAMLKNTIIANSPTGGNCSGGITDGGGNLSYPDTTCPGINSDPVLGTLRDNRGPTHTMALLSGSAALDAANDALCAAPPVNNLDQRGYPRPSGAHCDIGAYELFQPTNYVYLPIIRR
jgi:predicted outer membrane repeat protein